MEQQSLKISNPDRNKSIKRLFENCPSLFVERLKVKRVRKILANLDNNHKQQEGVFVVSFSDLIECRAIKKFGLKIDYIVKSG